eukprot:855747-Rhodomonas_salina.2
MASPAAPGMNDAPECSCRELGEFKPFAAFWLAEGGGVPTSRTQAPTEDGGDQLSRVGGSIVKEADVLQDWMEQETDAAQDDMLPGDKYWLVQSHRDGTAVEDQIFVRGCKMVWSCGQSVVTSLSMPTPVIQVVSCSFSKDNKSFRSSDDSCYPVQARSVMFPRAFCAAPIIHMAHVSPGRAISVRAHGERTGDLRCCWRRLLRRSSLSRGSTLRLRLHRKVVLIALSARGQAEMWETSGTLLLRAAEDEGAQSTPM